MQVYIEEKEEEEEEEKEEERAKQVLVCALRLCLDTFKYND